MKTESSRGQFPQKAAPPYKRPARKSAPHCQWHRLFRPFLANGGEKYENLEDCPWSGRLLQRVLTHGDNDIITEAN